MGAGLNSTATLAVLTSHYPERREEIMGYHEAAVGLGFLLGPLIGAGLYSIGGYALPFFGLSFFYFLLLPALVYVSHLVEEAEKSAISSDRLTKQAAKKAHRDDERINSDVEEEEACLLEKDSLGQDNEARDDSSSFQTKSSTMVDVKTLLANKRFFFGLLGQFCAYFALQFISPVLALRLADFGSTPEENGLLFAIPSLIYVLHMPLISVYTSVVSKRAVMMIGFALMALSMLFIGNSAWIFIPESLKFTMIGLVLLGIGFSAIVVPIFPEMLEALEEQNPAFIKSNEVNDLAAGMFNASMGVGESIGPILSGLINNRIGFRSSQEVLGVVIAVFTLTYLIFCGDQDLCKPSQRKAQSLGEQEKEESTRQCEKSSNSNQKAALRSRDILYSYSDSERRNYLNTPQIDLNGKSLLTDNSNTSSFVGAHLTGSKQATSILSRRNADLNSKSYSILLTECEEEARGRRAKFSERSVTPDRSSSTSNLSTSLGLKNSDAN